MLPKVNHYLYLQLMSEDKDEENEEYKCRVADVSSEYIFMEVPINVRTGKFKRFYKGDMLSVCFMTEDGVKHYFDSFVAGFREETIRQVAIRKPDEDAISSIQRRGFLRVPADLEISVKTPALLRFLALTEDVGGGGLSFVCESTHNLREGDTLSCWLLIQYRNDAVEHVPFTGDIVRIKPVEADRLLVMLSFADIQDVNRQKIIRYCFERQIVMHKK